VLDKRHIDSFYGHNKDIERRADAWAQYFIDSLGL
jgi:hypothetical protein